MLALKFGYLWSPIMNCQQPLRTNMIYKESVQTFWKNSIWSLDKLSTSLTILESDGKQKQGSLCLKPFTYHNQKYHLMYSNLFETLTNIPGIVDWKDQDHNFLGCNHAFLDMAGLRRTKDIVGKKDADFPWGADGFDKIFRVQDQPILDGKSKLVLGRYDFVGGECTMLVKKIPFKIGHQILGMINYLIDIEYPCLFNILHLLQKNKVPITAELVNNIKIFLKTNGSILHQFTKREEDCLYYFLRGASIKDIAKQLKISPRTVEVYIQNIKDKLHCSKKNKLIAKAILSGYLSIIPDRILYKHFGYK